ncbi:MAG: hypothetical protein ACO222_07110 [Polynucleobacter sp.]
MLASSLLGTSYAKELSFTAIGDQPYFSNEAFRQLINRINQHPQSKFTIHVGDIKNGASVCSDETFLEVKKLFDGFEKPLVFTPGDNEWTDCHRASNGSYQQLERLEKVRSVFFQEGKSLGQQALRLENQSKLMPKYRSYIENQRWADQDVLFVTIHQVGSNNNLDHQVPGAIAEHQARNAANMAWLNNSFQLAKNKKYAAVVIAMQSDIFDPRVPKESGFKDFIQTISKLSASFKKPILLIQGDSHQYVVDQPIKNQAGETQENVLRLIVPGASLVDAVEVTIDTDKKTIQEVFTFNKYSKN